MKGLIYKSHNIQINRLMIKLGSLRQAFYSKYFGPEIQTMDLKQNNSTVWEKWQLEAQ